jgi:hypothetical protein
MVVSSVNRTIRFAAGAADRKTLEIFSVDFLNYNSLGGGSRSPPPSHRWSMVPGRAPAAGMVGQRPAPRVR